MALRLNNSCIARGFFVGGNNCGGYGDPCLSCTGIRDIDYLRRLSNQPHDYSWSNANCSGSDHCRSAVYSEAVWSLWKRILPFAYNYDTNTAQEIVTRLTYVGGGNVSTWFSGGPPFGGCSAFGGYLNYLAADDDNGNLSDGTPHMVAIFDAFDDQEIACDAPTVQDSGCAGTPTSAPSLTATPQDRAVSLSWGAVNDASGYEVFRTDGLFACDFGKVRLGEPVGTSFNDSGLQNGRAYSYVVIPKGVGASCFGPASNCATVTPAASGPGAVDGLTLSTAAPAIELSWNPSCSAGATDYAVYEGTMGDWSDHAPNVCSTSGATSTTVTPSAGDRYFLIVPLDAGSEGSRGTDSDGDQRGVGSAPCRSTQILEACP